MVSLSVLALILSVIAVVLAFGAVAMVVDVRARVQTYEFTRRGGLEGQTSKGTSTTPTKDGPGITKSAFSSEQSVPDRFRPVPATSPTVIAPGLKNPPRVKGGFGSQTHAPQFQSDNKAGRGEQDEDSSSSQGSISQEEKTA